MECYIAIRTASVRTSRPNAAGTYEVAISQQPDGKPLFLSLLATGSVDAAKRIAESFFGPLNWRQHADGDRIRASATYGL